MRSLGSGVGFCYYIDLHRSALTPVSRLLTPDLITRGYFFQIKSIPELTSPMKGKRHYLWIYRSGRSALVHDHDRAGSRYQERAFGIDHGAPFDILRFGGSKGC